MIENGLLLIQPHSKDYSLIPTFGDILPDPQGLPTIFTVYDGREIPDQRAFDLRFNPPARPMPFGCTGETGTFMGGIEKGLIYRPDDLYDNTPPGTDGEGRDIRQSLSVMKNWGLLPSNNGPRDKFGDYYNVYGSGKIDDFDAVRIALWINQGEKRAVSVGSWWYWGSAFPSNGVLMAPSFRISDASLHNYIVTGWNEHGLEAIPWCGMLVGDKGKVYISREIFNRLMAQPYTGSFTIAPTPATGPLPVGWQAIVDHLVYYVKSLFNL